MFCAASTAPLNFIKNSSYVTTYSYNQVLCRHILRLKLSERESNPYYCLWNYTDHLIAYHISNYRGIEPLITLATACCHYTIRSSAPKVGLEPTAIRLTAERSTIELLGNNLFTCNTLNYPTKIRTWTKRFKVSCATITLQGNIT